MTLVDTGAKTSIVYSDLSVPRHAFHYRGVWGKNYSHNTNLAEIRCWVPTSLGTYIYSTSSGIYIGEWQKKVMIVLSNGIKALWSNKQVAKWKTGSPLLMTIGSLRGL